MPTETNLAASSLEFSYRVRFACNALFNRANVAADGICPVHRSNRSFKRSISVGRSRMTRIATLRAASTNCSSFHNTSACSGVFVVVRRVTQYSRVGASNVSKDGGGTARFQYVYRLRRHNSSFFPRTYSRVFDDGIATSCQSPSG